MVVGVRAGGGGVVRVNDAFTVLVIVVGVVVSVGGLDERKPQTCWHSSTESNLEWKIKFSVTNKFGMKWYKF